MSKEEKVQASPHHEFIRQYFNKDARYRIFSYETECKLKEFMFECWEYIFDLKYERAYEIVDVGLAEIEKKAGTMFPERDLIVNEIMNRN